MTQRNLYTVHEESGIPSTKPPATRRNWTRYWRRIVGWLGDWMYEKTLILSGDFRFRFRPKIKNAFRSASSIPVHHKKFLVLVLRCKVLVLKLRSWSWSWSWKSLDYITGCAVGQHCYNGDVWFLWENLELWPPVKFKSFNRLSQNLSQLIMSTRGTLVPSLVKIRSRRTSGQIGEVSLSCDFLFIFFLRHAQRSNPLTDFYAWWLKMRGITQGCAFWGLKYLILTFDPYLPPKMSNFAPK